MRVATQSVVLGTDVSFGPGMNVLRAANNRGKTQVVQAIIFALGMERMFGPEHSSHMGSVFTQRASVQVDGAEEEEDVLWSWCSVELENEAGEVLLAQRFPKHRSVSINLVRVWQGSGSIAADAPPEDYYVHESGGYSNESGYTGLLSRFLGWRLPEVPRYGSQPPAPLYPDVVFPLLCADQKSWNSAGPRKVSQYQIREPGRHAIEFLLGLEGPFAEARRAELEGTAAALKNEWTQVRSAAVSSAGVAGARLVNVPVNIPFVRGEESPLEQAGLATLGRWGVDG